MARINYDSLSERQKEKFNKEFIKYVKHLKQRITVLDKALNKISNGKKLQTYWIKKFSIAKKHRTQKLKNSKNSIEKKGLKLLIEMDELTIDASKIMIKIQKNNEKLKKVNIQSRYKRNEKINAYLKILLLNIALNKKYHKFYFNKSNVQEKFVNLPKSTNNQREIEFLIDLIKDYVEQGNPIISLIMYISKSARQKLPWYLLRNQVKKLKTNVTSKLNQISEIEKEILKIYKDSKNT